MKKVLVLFITLNFLSIYLYAATEENYRAQTIQYLFDTGLYETAQQEIDRYFNEYQHTKNEKKIRLIQGNIFYIYKLYDEANLVFSEVLSDIKDNQQREEIIFKLIVGHIEEQSFQKAAQFVKVLLLEFPQTEFYNQIKFYEAVMSFYKEEWDKVEIITQQISQELLLESKQKQALLYYQAISYYHTGKINELSKKFFQIYQYENFPVQWENEIKSKIALLLLKNEKFILSKNLFVQVLQEEKTETLSLELLSEAQFGFSETIYYLYKDSSQDVSLEELHQAIDLYGKLLADLQRPYQKTAYYHQAFLLYHTGSEENIRTLFDNLQQSPDVTFDAADLVLQTEIFVLQNNLDKAENIIKREIQKQDRSSLLLHATLFNFYKNTQQCEKLDTYIENSRYKLTDVIITHLYSAAGNCFFEKKEYKNALKYYEKISPASTHFLSIAPQYLQILRINKSYEKGLEIFQQIASFPIYFHDQTIIQNGVIIYKNTKRFQQLIAFMETILEIYPEDLQNPDYILVYAQALHQQNFLAPAEIEYKKYLRLEIDDEKKGTVLQEIAIIYEKMGKYELAIKTYTSSLELIVVPSLKYKAILNIGKIYRFLDNIKESEKWLLQIVNKGSLPENFEAAYYLGDYAIIRKHFKTGSTILLETTQNKNLKKTEWYIPINFKLAQLYQYREIWDRALKHYENVIPVKNKKYLAEKKEARIQANKIRKYIKQINSQ